MHKFRAQDESVMLQIRGHKSRQLVHLEVHKLNLKHSHRSRVSCFILHEHPLHSQDARKLMQADEKLWYPRVDEIQSNNKKKLSFSRVTN